MNGRKIGTCLLFLLGAVLVDRALGGLLERGLQHAQTGQHIGLANAAFAQRDTDIVIFGNSRARHHLMPSLLTEATGCQAYNAGVNGHGMVYNRMVESIMLSRGSDARLFVMIVDPLTLMVFLDERAMAMTPFVDENPTVKRLIRDVTKAPDIKLLSRAYRFNGSALPIARDVVLDRKMAGDGFVALRGSMAPGGDDEVPVPEPYPHPIEVREEVVNVIREFVNAARDNGTDVVFVMGPMLQRWIEEQEGYERLVALADELSVRLIVADEAAHEGLRDATLYKNLSHLNGEGAKRFSRIVANELAASDLSCASGGRFANDRFSAGSD